MRTAKAIAVLCLVLGLALARRDRALTPSKGDVLAKTRNGRVLSLFNVVTFKNNQCTGSSSTSSNSVMGTCLSSTECSDKGDSTADGSCASGFGVCCVITISGTTTTVYENNTYVQNTGYPSAVTSTSTTYTTTISRPSDKNLCQIRLDFENFVTLTSTASAGACGTTGDSFTVSAPFSSSTSAFPQTVCGTLTGQHMYFETGATGNPTYTITTGTASGDRTWRILVTWIECGSPMRAPVGCDQYFTGTTGVVESYGYSTQEIQGMRSSLCVRQEAGYCSIQWSENPGVTDAFNVGPTAITTAAETTEATCANAALSIGSTTVCGAVFSGADGDTIPGSIVSSILPFKIYHWTSSGTALTSLPGFSLSYTQIPC